MMNVSVLEQIPPHDKLKVSTHEGNVRKEWLQGMVAGTNSLRMNPKS